MENVKAREPWNKGKLVGQKPPPKQKDIWATCSRSGCAARQETLSRKLRAAAKCGYVPLNFPNCRANEWPELAVTERFS